MSHGFIKLYRRFKDEPIFADAELWKLWTLCLLRATYKERWIPMNGVKMPVQLLPGQFVTGRFKLYEDYYPGKKKNNKSALTLWRWMRILEKMGYLNIESNNKFSIITITNWARYQFLPSGDEHKSNQQMSNTQSRNDHQMITNKNKEKKENNIKKNNTSDHSFGCIYYEEKFEKLWERYPLKDGEKQAFQYFKNSVKTEQDLTDINTALDNYLKHLSLNTWKHPKNGMTWFSNWHDWVNWEEPEIRQVPGGMVN